VRLKVVTGAALAAVLVAFMLRALAPRPPSPVLTAEQQRTEEIFRTNRTLPGDPQLAAEYRAINARYYDDQLPSVRLRWEPRLDEIGPMIADGFRMSGVTDGTLILLNPAVQESEAEFRRVLCHEIVHIVAVSERQPHGPVFQAYLKQLLDKGAFTGIVATEAEKQERRREIDRRSADLAADEALLARLKTELEATSAGGGTAEETNARVAALNDRVRRHNDAVIEFNRSVEEYNQMVAYPDGLDRERLNARAPLSREP
jgi:hypothetical protein